jgi:hypothetical protein
MFIDIERHPTNQCSRGAQGFSERIHVTNIPLLWSCETSMGLAAINISSLRDRNLPLRCNRSE